MIALYQASGTITLRQSTGSISLSIGKGSDYSLDFTQPQNNMYLILL